MPAKAPQPARTSRRCVEYPPFCAGTSRRKIPGRHRPSGCRLRAMEPLFIRACRGETTERAPLWLMRQAGRYLPEYREVRAGVSFLELCKTPKLAAEVTLQPIRRFGFDAAILFSDLLVPLEAMGLEVEFTDKGPTLPQPLRTPDALGRISKSDPAARTGFVMETIQQVRRDLGDTPLIGF